MSPSTPHPSRLRLGALALLLTVITAFAAPATSLASSASSAWTARIRVSNREPRTCTDWHIAITATRGRQRLSGKVEYYYFTPAEYSTAHLGANVTAGSAQNHYGNFSQGLFKDALVLPSRYATGVALDFNAVVNTRYGTQTVSTTVTPKPNRRRQCD